MATTFERAKQRWNQHACTSQAGVCDCPFDFHCESCDDIVKAVGESMPEYIGLGGLCIYCFYRDQLMDTTPDIGPSLAEQHYRALEEVNREEERAEIDRYHRR